MLDRLTRLAAEFLAVAILTMIWGWAVGLSAIAVLLLVGALRRDPITPAEQIPTLQDRADGAEQPKR